MQDDTIYAPATPEGRSAVAIIRVSGPKAFAYARQIFRPLKKKHISEHGSFPQVLVGHLMDGEEVLDQAVLLLFRAPHSYTGEDVVEFQCHGSIYIVRRLGQILSNLGGRLARPGEFTLRAFLNRKMSLTQAEAVIDLIEAETQAQQRLAMSQMRGGYAERLERLRTELLEVMALVELELDFSTEDVEFASRDRLRGLLEEIQNVATRLTASFATGQALRQGVPVAIIGAPNAGKSTLLNALVQDERALVSPIAGTTRDTVEDYLIVGGVSFRLVDTAGLRDTQDPVEIMGIERAFSALSKARIVIWVHAPDARLSKELENQIRPVIQQSQATLITVWNKQDLAPPDPTLTPDVIPISARTGQGVEIVRQALLQAVQQGSVNPAETLSNLRHYQALSRCLEGVARALDILNSGQGSEMLAFELREVATYLGSITGAITPDEVLGAIFSRFCIGK
ncbi:MAG: tRNA uridine-5-carboxymethylaminomethyl(34) synthesis GTPase MnmE [Flavobacteriales bacterium]|nr:tRNA uridine-5-carboxymethylaminomethyl(34) synthesis GTPase MnmE [Flavobacteriales bacterium]MCX7768702.1 tRNA uridine-5-carboxymethylaminomethyl(34) synthesis GTPase MnmE [Flavobacteriales bacterium]MDW8410099.1 tRNA uridine-5-carboxymethylaminomethyl(34) synthesis GTPase MnmE [Flavobacteriales bacterium]